MKFKFDKEMWQKALFCARCGTCRTVHGEQIQGLETGLQCPSGTNYLFESYYPAGRSYAAVALKRGELKWSERLVDVIYSCTTCGFCQYTCERTNVNKPTDIIRWLRREAVEAGVGPLPGQQIIVQNIEAYDNPWGQPRARRTGWIKGLPFKIKDLSKGQEKAEVLLYPGCTYAFDPKIQHCLKYLAHLLYVGGIDFGILGKSEKCCGSTAYNLGFIKVIEKLGEENLKTFKELEIQTIVTPCSGCLNTFKNLYPQMSEVTFQAKHSVEVLAELVKEGKIQPVYKMEKIITYHDPCHLGRHAKIFDAPREILKAIPGIKLIEMDRIREYSFCCGGGGGVRTGKRDFALATAKRRIQEALGTGANVLTTACPFCSQNFLDELEQLGTPLEFFDVVELLYYSVFGELALRNIKEADT